jgi:hypothetical protein
MINFAIPIALQIVIDDVGWWSGRDGSEYNEPYRTGIDRAHVPEDYLAIVELGRKLNMRPQAAMILSEWDTTHSLKNLPTAQWMGSKWHNPWPIEPMQQAADIYRNNTDCMELTLHGIGHEHWQHPDKFTRAEWSDRNGAVRPREHIMGVLDAFARLLDQHNLGPFPTSFIPCAFAHGFNTDLAKWLYAAGIRHLSTPFRILFNREETQDKYFGIEHSVLTIDRGDDGINWDVIEAEPDYQVHGPIVGTHWPNILHTDPARNLEVVDRWAAMLKPYNDSLETMLAPDTASCWTQLVYHRKTKLTVIDNGCDLDFTEVDKLPSCDLRNTFTLKTNAPPGAHFECQGVKLVDASQGVLQIERLDCVDKAEIRCCHPSG